MVANRPIRLWYLPPGVEAAALVDDEGAERLHGVTPALIQETVRALDRALPALASLSIRTIIAAIDRALRYWLAPDSPAVELLLRHGPRLTGYAEEALRYAIDPMLREFTAERLERLLMAECGQPAVLDEFVRAGPGVSRTAHGPGRQVHILAGSVPTVGIFSVIRGLLVKSPVLAKSSRHDPLFPALFAQTLAEVEPRLAGTLAVIPWPGGDAPSVALLQAAMAGAGAVVAYGSDESIASVRQLSPASARFVGYGNKLSLAAVSREALTRDEAARTAGLLAWDVALFDQQGCLSPQFALVEQGGEVSPIEFGELLAGRLADLEVTCHRGAVTAAEAAQIRALRDWASFKMSVGKMSTSKMAMGGSVHVWQSSPGTDWTVVLADEPAPERFCKNRTIWLVPVESLESELAAYCGRFPVSTVGLASSLHRNAALAAAAVPYATRVCPLGKMGEPPATWHHDGRPVLADLVTWVDWET